MIVTHAGQGFINFPSTVEMHEEPKIGLVQFTTSGCYCSLLLTALKVVHVHKQKLLTLMVWGSGANGWCTIQHLLWTRGVVGNKLLQLAVTHPWVVSQKPAHERMGNDCNILRSTRRWADFESRFHSCHTAHWAVKYRVIWLQMIFQSVRGW